MPDAKHVRACGAAGGHWVARERRDDDRRVRTYLLGRRTRDAVVVVGRHVGKFGPRCQLVDAALAGGPRLVVSGSLGTNVGGRVAQQREDFEVVRLVEPRVVCVDAADARCDEEQAVEDYRAEKESALTSEVSRVRPRLDKVAEHFSFLPRAGANGSKRETRKLRPRVLRDGSTKVQGSKLISHSALNLEL